MNKFHMSTCPLEKFKTFYLQFKVKLTYSLYLPA